MLSSKEPFMRDILLAIAFSVKYFKPLSVIHTLKIQKDTGQLFLDMDI